MLEVERLRKQGYTVEHARTKEGLEAAKRACVAVISNGSSDLPAQAFMGARIIQLWHGTPLKKILLDYEPDYRLGPLPLSIVGTPAGRWLMTRAFDRYDLVPASSELAASRLATAFGLPEDRIVITGQPREDVILGKGVDCDPLEGGEESIAAGKSILWAPTYRQGGGGIPWAEAPWIDISKMLEAENATLRILLHPFERTPRLREAVQGATRVRVNEQADIDINVLMRHSDVLLTDFSSVAFDYSILDRPIVLFAPDLDEYTAKRPLYEDYHMLAGGEDVRSWGSLLSRLREALSNPCSPPLTTRLSRRYAKFSDGRARERIVAEIRSRFLG